MNICGLQKLAMVDYPGKIAATVFTGGCNLRCPFCHNALLVTRLDETPRIDVSAILTFLKTRQNLLDGVVLSGGEPLLQRDAADFLKAVRDLGFAVKLDTNGCYPDALAHILDAGLVDYVAMDIKNVPEKYPLTVGVPTLDLAPILDSTQLLQTSGTEYEFRTTLVQELHTPEDVLALGDWLRGTPRYALQKFVDSGELICHNRFHSFSDEEMQVLADSVRPCFGTLLLRGVE